MTERTPSGAWLALALSVMLSGILLMAVEADWGAFIALTGVAVTAVLVGRRTLLHPYAWYVPLFWLYSIAHPVLVWLGQAVPAGFLRFTLFLEWLALSTFVLVVGPRQVGRPLLRPLTSGRRTATWLLLGLATIPCILLMLEIQAGQFRGSREIVATSTLITRYQWAVAVLTLMYLVLLGDAVLRKERFWLPCTLLMIGFGWPVLSLLIASQRSDVFRVIWVTLLLAHVLRPKLTGMRLAPIAIGILLLVPVAQGLRSSLVVGSVTAFEESANPVVRLLKSEFHAASENLALVTSRWAETRYYGKSFLWDLITTIRPNFLFPNRDTEDSITNQFNIQMYRDVFRAGGGQGFTLVGEGYANFGPLGVVLVFAVVGVLVRCFYGRSDRDLVSLSAYIMAGPVMAVAIRGDLSNITSQWLKHVILPSLLVVLLGDLLSVRRRSRNAQAIRRAEPAPITPSRSACGRNGTNAAPLAVRRSSKT